MMRSGAFLGSPAAKNQKLRPRLAGGFGQRLDAAVIDVRPAVEDDFLDAGLGGALGDQLADGGRRGDVGAGLQRTLQVLFEASKRQQRCGPSNRR